MFGLISVLIIIVCVLLVMVVLVQNSKGGGLSASFGGSNQVMGVRRTTDFLEKATWTLATALLVLSLLASIAIPKVREESEKSLIEDQIENAIDPERLPAFPTTVPEQTEEEMRDKKQRP